MNRLRTLIYSFKDGLYNLKRGGITGIISIITIAFTMLNIGLFFLLWINISPLFKGWMEEVKVIGYLKEDISEGRIKELSGALAALPNVQTVTFISKSEALKRFKENLCEDQYLLEGINENPLPASLEVILDESSKLESLDKIAQELRATDAFEDVQSAKEWMHKLSAFLVIVKIVGILVGGVLLFVSIFIISNTVRLTFINRKEEVEIMRLVGAHRWFIKLPFLIEGLVDGFLGGGISICLLYLLYYVMRCKLKPYLFGTMGTVHLSFIPVSMTFVIIGIGMGVGGIGSLFSLKI